MKKLFLMLLWAIPGGVFADCNNPPAGEANCIQVQTFVDQRIRPFAELVRSANLQGNDNIASITSVYNTLVDTTSIAGWHDTNSSNPPNLLTASDVLAINAFLHDFQTFIQNETNGTQTAINANTNYMIIQKACVRQIGG